MSTPEPGTSVYLYTPIKDPGTIRLLTLQPGEGDATLVGALTSILVDQSRHKSLTYVWGDPNPSESLI
jgi:hypothetical protein